jgi:hypothetical protein
MTAVTTLIAATTDAVAASLATEVRIPFGKRALFLANNLATTETCAFTLILANGTSKAALDTDLTTLLLTATDYQKGINGPCVVRVAKDATAGACSVTVYQ